MTWTLKDIPDQTGRVAVVTGSTSGIGFEAARALAERGATVVLACRNLDKADQAASRIGHGAQVVELDLASLASVERCAEHLLARHARLDLLLNNAGVMAPPYGQTADGFELQIGTNHLGHFALTGRLLDRLRATSGARIVNVASVAHFFGRMNFEDLHSRRGYVAFRAYGQSKLANLLFTYELQRRLQAAGADTLAVAAHPGWSRTELQRHAKRNPVMALGNAVLEMLLSQDQRMGALPTLRAAVDPSVGPAEYFGPSGFLQLKGHPVKVASNARSHDRSAQARLWEVSQVETGVRCLP